MKVSDIIKTKGDQVETVRADATVPIAVHKLATMGIGALVVSPDGERVEGVIAERDVVRGLARHGARLLEMRVSEVMSKGTPTCHPDDNITGVMAQMTRTRNRHLPVLEDGRLRGIVSLGDVVKKRLDDLELEAAVLRETWIARR
ncbi:MAG: CBS domain-containing protein [Actinomycetota bacterium]|nr:CBS domain-containing protein [Actinomycetota bacterium]